MVNCTAITNVSKHNLHISKRTATHYVNVSYGGQCPCINEYFKSVWIFQKHEKIVKIGTKR